MNILVAGDYCPQHRVSSSFDDNDYASVLGEVRSIMSHTDYSVVNLECPVIRGSERPIVKQGPNLHCTENGIAALKWAGFNCVTLANNHFYDFGDEGVAATLSACSKHGLDVVGGGKDLKRASRTLYKEIGGQRLAIINCCEHEFSIATETTGGSNPLNPIQQYYAIKEARKNADYVLVIVHGGHEYYQLPSPRMQETYRFFIDAGADVVVNHHQHCYSGYEIYHDRPVFYGLGNFCFDDSKNRVGKWNEGYLVLLHMDEKISFDIIPFNQCSDQADVRLLDSNAFDAELKRLNDIIIDSYKLKQSIENYYKSCSKYYSDILEPCMSRYYLALKHRGWMPSFISTKRKLKAANYMCCESHRDKLFYYLIHQ